MPGAEASGSAVTWRTLLVGRSLRASLTRAGLLAATLLVVSQYLLSPVRARGISMQPALSGGEWLWLWRPAYLTTPPARGDIVAVEFAGGRAVLVKRVIGLPGERISITGGVVFVNGVPLDEPYVTRRAPWMVDETTLASDEIYVIGDNRGMAVRAHDFGRVELRRVAGRILGR